MSELDRMTFVQSEDGERNFKDIDREKCCCPEDILKCIKRNKIDIRPHSLTYLFLEKPKTKHFCIDSHEPLLLNYLNSFQLLQATVLKGEPKNLSKIGQRFEMVERVFKILCKIGQRFEMGNFEALETKEMNKLIFVKRNTVPRSLTHIFSGKPKTKNKFCIDAYEEPFGLLILKYKRAIEKLQKPIFTAKNLSEIGHCFERVERNFEKLTVNLLKKNPQKVDLFDAKDNCCT